MRKNDRKKLEDKLAQMPPDQQRALYQLAAKMRKAQLTQSRVRDKHVDPDPPIKDDESDEQTDPQTQSGRSPKHDNRPTGKMTSLQDWVLSILEQGAPAHEPDRLDAPQNQSFLLGTLIAVKAGTGRILYQHQEHPCILRPHLAIAQRSDLAIGDEISFSIAENGTYILEQPHARRSILSRPDTHDPRVQRAIAANVDIAVIVGSVAQPTLKPNLLDRYILSVQRGNIKPLICINKMDLMKDKKQGQEIEDLLKGYQDMDIPTCFCSAENSEGIDQLKQHLTDKQSVLVGQSGTGKSSLINKIVPGLDLTTATIRKNLKGRHTTVSSYLYELPGGGRIIDTPGVREFGLWKMTDSELRWYFSEFDPFAQQCKFNDCTHTHEPKCAVKQAVENEKIPPRRYQSYLRMFQSLND